MFHRTCRKGTRNLKNLKEGILTRGGGRHPPPTPMIHTRSYHVAIATYIMFEFPDSEPDETTVIGNYKTNIATSKNTGDGSNYLVQGPILKLWNQTVI